MSESMAGLKRSMRVAEVSEANLGQELTLMGWCHLQRDLGKIVFLTLRDRSGELQLVIDEESGAETLVKAQKVRAEYVLACVGTFRKRQDPNPDMPTGAYELHVHDLRILSESKTPPFYVDEGGDQAREALRLEYRYLDLRRPRLQHNLIKRHEIAHFTRNWFSQKGFLEIETPTLIKSTPEGARDYLVPSRIFPGEFFALPQSPQLFKQLLMVAGYDRYMQLARCFRDEDLRADRQPEFTQIDLEMSFVSAEDVRELVERYIHDLLADQAGVEVKLPLPRMTWDEAMERYGSDKPDIRFGMEIHDVSDLAGETDFKVFSSAVADGGIVGAIAVPGGSQYKRRRLDELSKFAQDHGAKGLVWMSYEEPLRGSATKFLGPDFMAKLADRCGAGQGDLFLLIADEKYKALEVLGRLRLEIGRELDLINKSQWAPLWIIHFPMFEYSAEEDRLVAAHHPFTMPLEEDLNDPKKEPIAWRANAYDMVMNGYELGSGSLRIFDPVLQARIFDLLGIPQDEAQRRFGFLLKAFEYGVPPHAGIALGLDRLTMLLCGSDNIRDVIAFPKVQNSSDLMSGCPSNVDPAQLAELGLGILPQVAKEKLEDLEQN